MEKLSVAKVGDGKRQLERTRGKHWYVGLISEYASCVRPNGGSSHLPVKTSRFFYICCHVLNIIPHLWSFPGKNISLVEIDGVA